MLHESLLGGAGKEACFWVLRELVRGGQAPEGFAAAAVVPTARLLRHAHRLGLIERVELDTLEDLVAASSAVGVFFGADSGYGEALEAMDHLLTLAPQS
jgi:hypothetical protein